MAHTLVSAQTGQRVYQQTAGAASVRQADVYFRALVDLGNGDVAGIEAAQARPLPLAGTDSLMSRPADTVEPGLILPQDPLGVWGNVIRHPAAYLVRGDLERTAEALGATVDAPASRIIVMYDMSVLLTDPGRALDVLLAAKRRGARVLVDNFNMDDPPARFMEMLPADILRLDIRRLPWHWDDARREEAITSLVRFAGNLLMDVAAEGVKSIGQRIELKQLGIRYGQGRWLRDMAGVLSGNGA